MSQQHKKWNELVEEELHKTWMDSLRSCNRGRGQSSNDHTDVQERKRQ